MGGPINLNFCLLSFGNTSDIDDLRKEQEYAVQIIKAGTF
jgi:hypothetical protein